MLEDLKPGMAFELEFEVAESMCPHFDGTLVHPVCATWTLCHHMEVAGRKLLAPYLAPHEEAVGAHISIDHRAPAVIGSAVRVRAEVTHATHRRLEATVSAHAGERLLASGKFVQIILSKERLAAILDHLGPVSSR
ncbi:MAG: thioesterase [Phycisphaerales bacterium]|nr:thioesterase [Phycisphaerales bacterium]